MTRLNLPQQGSGSAAPWGRRFLALLVDWAAATGIVVALLGPTGWLDDPLSGWYTLGVFAVEAALFTAFVGGSFGQLATRIRVVRVDGRPLGLFQALLRSVLICLVIPPLVFDPDGRGLHDLAVGSVAIRL